jgi:Zn-dependent protease
MPKDALAEARVGLAGPVLGTLGGLTTLGLYAATQNPVFLGLAYFNFIINLFNLAPLLPLDGGRAVGAMSPVFQLLGLVTMVGLFFVAPIMVFIALLGLPRCGTGGRRVTPRRGRRTTISRRDTGLRSAWCTWA